MSVGSGVDVFVGTGVLVGIGVDVFVGMGVSVDVGVGVFVGTGVSVGVGVDVLVLVGLGVSVNVAVGVLVEVGVAVSVGTGVLVGLEVGVEVLSDRCTLGALVTGPAFTGGCRNASTSSTAVPAFWNVILIYRAAVGLNCATTVSPPGTVPLNPVSRELKTGLYSWSSLLLFPLA